MLDTHLCRLTLLGVVLLVSTNALAQREKVLRLSTEEVAGEQHYRQRHRPQYHYSPMQGFIGDATGMVYYKGQYHLFYMYDQWHHERRTHKRWGHAVSPDMVHWEEKPPVLDTLVDNRPGSGCGLIDWNNSLGLAQPGRERPLIIFYTHYDKGTSIAYSYDNGESWTRHPSNPVLEGDSHRDPLVFWYEPDNSWRMVRYEDQSPDKKRFSFYKSENLLDWELLSQFWDVYECPDFVRLPVENSDEPDRWVLIDGNGTYFVGDFDGTEFTVLPNTGRQRVDHGALYATQSWKKTRFGGSPPVQMAWLRYPREFHGTTDPQRRLTWWGQQSFPCSLHLRRDGTAIKLCRRPIEELKNLHESQGKWLDKNLVPGDVLLSGLEVAPCEIVLTAKVSPSATLTLTAGVSEITWSPSSGMVVCDGKEAPYNPDDDTLRLQCLLDRSSIEVFLGNGETTISLPSFDWSQEGKLSLEVSGGDAHIDRLECNTLRSIWEAHEK